MSGAQSPRQIVWTAAARRDLEGIRDYIGRFNPSAARSFALRLITIADQLDELADRGRPFRGIYRELTFVRPYLIRYRVTSDTVYILRIRHGARSSG